MERATSGPSRAILGMVVALLAAGCSAPRSSLREVDPAGIARQLALACHQDAASSARTGTQPWRSRSVVPGAAAAAAAASESGTVVCAPATAVALPGAARGDAAISREGQPSAVGAGDTSGIETGSLASAGLAASRLPPPMVFRYAPESIRLRSSDATTLFKAVAGLVDSETLRLDVAVGRGGAGNGFDQAAVASARLRAIEAMLPPQVLGTVAYDPSLPDDTVSFHVVVIASSEPDVR